MNYPTVLQNPLVRKREETILNQHKTKAELEEDRKYKFNNLQRPKTGMKPTDNFRRPFSTKDGGETLMKRRIDMQINTFKRETSMTNLDEAQKNEYFQKKLKERIGDKGLPYQNSLNRISSASTNFQFGRSIQSGFKRFEEDQPLAGKSTAVVFDKVDTTRAYSAFPVKKKKLSKKEQEELKKQEEEEAARLAAIPRVMTNCEALSQAPSLM